MIKLTSKYKYCLSVALLFLLLFSNFTFFSTLNTTISNVYAIDDNIVFDFSIAKDTSEKLMLVYREKKADTDSILFMETDEAKVWNKTRTKILTENTTFTITGSPQMITRNKTVLIVTGYNDNISSGIVLSNRAEGSKKWSHQKIITNINGNLISPILKFNAITGYYWLTWRDNHEGETHQYVTTSSTLDSWSNITKISPDSPNAQSDCDFIFDADGFTHFILSRGNVYHEQLYYYKISNNLTIYNNETITESTYGARDPTIILDAYNNLNVFWTNYTTDEPGYFLGKVFVYSKFKPINGNWSNSFEVGPYVPPDRSASGESDGYNPAVIEDEQNQLWLAYEIIEEYAYRSGIDIRKRIISNWQPSEFLSLVTNRATDPVMIIDESGNIHCFWLDRRSGTSEIFFRVKYASGGWSDETSLSDTIGTPLRDAFIIAGIIVGGMIIVSLPTIILKSINRRRQKKAIQERIKELRK